MLTTRPVDPPDRRVYLLADHLDAILALGEDLKKLQYICAARGALSPASDKSLTLNRFVQNARALEIAMMGRIKLAREHACQLAGRSDDFAILAQLFASGTTVVIDAIDEICDSEMHAFKDGFDPLVFLRKRGLIDEDAGCLSVVEDIVIEDAFLVAERIELGPLLDLASKFLGVLDEQFDLFPEIPPAPRPRPARPSIRDACRAAAL